MIDADDFKMFVCVLLQRKIKIYLYDITYKYNFIKYDNTVNDNQ